MRSIEFVVPGKATPYCRTTQKAKHVNKQYKKYKEYSQWVQACFMKARLESALKSMASAVATSIMSSKESSIHLTASHTGMTSNVSKQESSFVKVKITYEEEI